ncbi:hypothetical protein TIFTF001_014405 [Ficus carica]|uniref:Non-haem dioxygenase N-terminal domain-containing protein n=1 Tax=Ficus carica TaxID=3494 RepID=A0AA88D428_FICCA|nr:hypothetical protein TIFTF001_014405 [Ficus carica]
MEMGNSEDHGKAQIPIINFPKEIVGLDHEQGSTGGEEWKGKSGKMREAFEKYGCFILKCEENIPNYNMTSSSSSSCSSSREQIFMASKALFDLPDETKQKHTSSKPYRSYAANCPAIPLSESFGIDNGSSSDAVHSFTYLMWPQGNKAFW